MRQPFLSLLLSFPQLISSSLPRIDNALPGRDGYEVEIFGMVGIPAPDVADYKRRKEIELGLSAGSISQPPPKRAKTDLSRPLTEEELRAQLEAHKALMSGGMSGTAPAAGDSGESTSVYGAPAQAYSVPPTPPVGGQGPTPPGPSPFAPGFAPGFPPPPGMMPPPGMAPPFPPYGGPMYVFLYLLSLFPPRACFLSSHTTRISPHSLRPPFPLDRPPLRPSHTNTNLTD